MLFWSKFEISKYGTGVTLEIKSSSPKNFLIPNKFGKNLPTVSEDKGEGGHNYDIAENVLTEIIV